MKNRQAVKAICKAIRKARARQNIWTSFEDMSKSEESRQAYFNLWQTYRAQERALRSVLKEVLQR